MQAYVWPGIEANLVPVRKNNRISHAVEGTHFTSYGKKHTELLSHQSSFNI